MSESRVRENRMPGLKRRGLETERQTGVTVTGVAQPTGKPAEHEGPRTYHTGEATAPVPDPTKDVSELANASTELRRSRSQRSTAPTRPAALPHAAAPDVADARSGRH